MSFPADQIRGLAKYFDNLELNRLFGITTNQVTDAFQGKNRPTPDLSQLPIFISVMAMVTADISRVNNSAQMAAGKVTEEAIETLAKKLDELDFSVRTANALQVAELEYVWQLVTKTEAELLKTKNFGRKSLNEVKELLREICLSLGMPVEHPAIILAKRRTWHA